jgi:putative transcriptional regulator
MSDTAITAPLRLRLKADGRLVEILPGGGEREVSRDAASSTGIPPARPMTAALARTPAPAAGQSRLADRLATLAPPPPKSAGPTSDATYARSVRAATKLTQAEFAARIGVPIETVRNWEQGKRAPRGPARALLKVIERAPDLAFAALKPA